MSLKRLTVLLLRDIASPDDAIRAGKNPVSVALDPASNLSGTFYYPKSYPSPPGWVSEVNDVLSVPITNVVSSSASGLLIIETSSQFFALTFGYGKGLLDPSKIQRQFGLRVALNRIDPTQIRSMDTKTFEDLVVTKNTQTSKSSDIPSFGVDVARDILRAVAGVPRDRTFATRLAGSDALVLSSEVEVRDLPAKCDELLTAYQDTAYKADFEWIDHLEIVSDAALLSVLDDAVVEDLRNGDTSRTHMATPEPIAWEDIDSFRIAGTRGATYDDLDLDLYLETLGADRSKITSDRLKSRTVSVVYTRSGSADGLWNLYQCLISEQRLNGQLYALIEGRWFAVSETLVDQVDRFVNALPIHSSALEDATVGELEPDYNKRMAQKYPGEFLLLDAKIKRPGGASTGIELCDLLAADGTLVHVKRKSRSATLSHLFAQGTVSATTFIGDGEFRDAVRETIKSTAPSTTVGTWLDLVPDSATVVDAQKYAVAYVVLAKAPTSGSDWLPFFSKLNLMQHGKQLQNMRLKVSVRRLDN